MEIPQKTKYRTTCDPATPHSWAYNPNKTFIQKHTDTPMFIAALFTIAETWKQPKCPSTDEWTKKMWHIYTKEYYSAVKKDKIMPFAATWMQIRDSYTK